MKKIYLISLLSFFSLNLFCQTNWTKHPEPVLQPGDSGKWDQKMIMTGSVIMHDDTFHMWYSGGDPDVPWMIGHATSADGISWTKDTNNPVLEPGPDGTWDDTTVWCPSVLFIDSEFHMWYAGYADFKEYPNSPRRIGHATSPDGISWTKDINNPVLDVGENGKWDDTWISHPSVINDGSNYHIWYTGDGGPGTYVQIGHATSPDGITWTKSPKIPVLSCKQNDEWDYDRADYARVIYDGNSYHMWYSGGKTWAWQIGYATSENGSSWTKYADNPVLLRGSTGSWDESTVVSCAVINSGDKYMMWYTGGSIQDDTVQIGYAESDCCPSGIMGVNQMRMSIHPIPTNGLLTIEINAPGKQFIELTSLNGQLLYSTKMEGPTLQIDLSSFHNGLYFITVRSRDYIRTEKIIKQ